MSTHSFTSHLKKGVTDRENAIILKLIKFVIQNENTTVEKLYSFRANLSISQREYIGLSKQKYQSFINKHSDIFISKNSVVEIRPEILSKLYFICNTSLRNEICTVEKANVGFGFLLTSQCETVFFGANEFEDGRIRDLSTALKCGDKVTVNAKISGNYLNSHWQATKVKKITDKDYKIIEFLVEHIKSKSGSVSLHSINLPENLKNFIGKNVDNLHEFIKRFSKYFKITDKQVQLTEELLHRSNDNEKKKESRIGVPGIIIDKYSLVLKTKQILPIQDKIWNESLFKPGNDILCNIEDLPNTGATVTKMNLVLSQKKVNSPIANANKIQDYIGAISHLFPTFGLIQHGKCKDDFIYFNQDSVLIGGKNPSSGQLKTVINVGDIVICNADSVSSLPCKYIANSVVLHTKSIGHSWNGMKLKKQIFNCHSRVIKISKENMFLRYENNENVYVKRSIFYYKASNQVDNLMVWLQLNDLVYFDAEEGDKSDACEWRAIVAWTKPELNDLDKQISTNGSIVIVNESEGIISIGTRSFKERVLFSVDNYHHYGERVADLSKVLVPENQVNFDAIINTNEIRRTKWIAILVWMGTKPIDSDNDLRNCEGEISKINIKDGIIKFSNGRLNGEVLFSVDEFYQDLDNIQYLERTVKVGDKVMFDAEGQGDACKCKWKALLVWKGERPKIVTRLDKKKMFEEELVKNYPLIYHRALDDDVRIVTIPNKNQAKNESDNVNSKSTFAAVTKSMPKIQEPAKTTPKKRKRKRSKTKNKSVEQPIIAEVRDKKCEMKLAQPMIKEICEIETGDMLLNYVGRMIYFLDTENGCLQVEDKICGVPFFVRFNIFDANINGRCENYDDVNVGEDYYFDAHKCNGEWVAFKLWKSNFGSNDCLLNTERSIQLDLQADKIHWIRKNSNVKIPSSDESEFLTEEIEFENVISNENEFGNLELIQNNGPLLEDHKQAENMELTRENVDELQLTENKKMEKQRLKKQKKRRRYKELRTQKQLAMTKSMENLEEEINVNHLNNEDETKNHNSELEISREKEIDEQSVMSKSSVTVSVKEIFNEQLNEEKQQFHGDDKIDFSHLEDITQECENSTDNCDKHNVRHALVVLPYPIRSDILEYLSQSGINYFEVNGCLKNYCNHYSHKKSGNLPGDITSNNASTQTVFTGQISCSNIYHDVD